MSRYMYSHIWSKIPNIVELGPDLGLVFEVVEQLLLQGGGDADNSPTLGCLGLAPSRLSKQWGMDIFPIFLLRLGSSRLMWIASLASLASGIF